MLSLANISLYLSPQTPPSMGLSHHTTAYFANSNPQGSGGWVFILIITLSPLAKDILTAAPFGVSEIAVLSYIAHSLHSY